MGAQTTNGRLATEMAPNDNSKIQTSGAAGDLGFAEELRAAIKASGLSLDRIQVRLQRRGVPISVTALSYWQSGKRQPERARSISAVRALEEILERPVGSLVDKLRSPRPRGPARQGTGTPGRTLQFRREALQPLLVRLGFPLALDQHVDLQLAGLNDRCEIAADGGQRNLTTRAVFKANADNQRRWLLVYFNEETAERLPVLRALRNCVVGRMETDDTHGIIVAELIFDPPINKGETCLIEYSLSNQGPPYPAGNNTYWREFRRPIREYLLELIFDPAHLPKRCHEIRRRAASGRMERRKIRLDRGGDAHAVALDFGPGVFGIEWDWQSAR